MPSLNDSVALGVKPPDTTGYDPLKTLSAISNYQQGQAHMGLYNLQAAQQARQLQGYAYLQSHPDDVTGAIQAGLDPSIANTYQTLQHNKFLYDKNGGYTPSELESSAKARQTNQQTAHLATFYGPDMRGLTPQEGEANAKGLETLQTVNHNAFLENQGGGYRPADSEANARTQNFQSETNLRGIDIHARIGSMAIGANTQEKRETAIEAARDAGFAISAAQKQQMLSAPQDVWDARARQLAYGGPQGLQNNPNIIAPKAAAEAYGAQSGRLGIDPNSVPLINMQQQQQQPAMQPSPGATITFNGGAGQTPAPSTPATSINPAAPLGQPPAAQPLAQPAAAPASPPVAQPQAPTPQPQATPQAPQPQSGMIDYTKPGAMLQAEGQIKATSDMVKEQLDQSAKGYNAAQALLARVPVIAHNIEALGPAWMGAGAEAKTDFAKGWNSFVESVSALTGVKPNDKMMFDSTKIAKSEEFYKEQIRAGMELINSNFGGSREAASIIQMGRQAVSGQGNTYLGAKYILATIKAAAQRQADLHEFKISDSAGGGSMASAEIRFNKLHPPQDYSLGAMAEATPPAAIAMLRSRPDTAKQFDDNFHVPGLAKFVLSQPAQQ